MNYLKKSKASSLAKVAQLPVYQHPADMLNTFTRPMNEQYAQMLGKTGLNQNKYISTHHEQLMSTLAKVRQQFSSTSQSQKRMVIAQKQHSLWNKYTNQLVTDLTEDQKLKDSHKESMYESFLVTKQRNQQRLALDRFANFANQYNKAFKMDFPIHPLVLLRMVHPHFGYLLNFKSKLTIEQIFTLWHEMITVSLIRYQGYSLHATQLLSFYFWKLHLKKKGYMSFGEFSKFLEHFKFTIKNEEEFRNKFRFTLAKRQNQLLSSRDIICFDLWRQISLDHDL